MKQQIKNVDSIELILIRQMVKAIAMLRIRGYTSTTFEDLKSALFVGLSDALKDQNISRKDSAAMMGIKSRSFYDLLNKAISQLENSQNGPDESLYYNVLLYINKNPEVTKHELLEHFGCYEDESATREAQIFASVNLLKERKLVWESGRGEDTSYTAPQAKLPDNGNINLLETTVEDHLKAVSQSILARCEDLLFNKQNDSFMLTATLDIDKKSVYADKVMSLIREFNAELNRIYDESESNQADRESPGDSMTMYIGQYWTQNGGDDENT